MKGSVNSSAVQVLGIITALLVISSCCLGSCAQTPTRRHHSIVEKALGSGARSGFQLCNTVLVCDLLGTRLHSRG